MKGNRILIFFRFVLLGAITFISAGAEAGGKGLSAGGGQRFAPDEIIIKVKGSDSSSISVQKDSGTGDAEVRLPADIDKVNKDYNIRGVRQVFAHFRQGQERLQGLRDGTRTAKTPLDKRLFRRFKRAQQPGAEGAGLERIYKVKVDGRPIEEVLRAYRSLPGVEYAELNYVVSTCVEPNDSLFGFQWALNNTGQMYPESGKYNDPPGTPDSDIDAPEGWDISAGIEDVVIAVPDTGVYYTHRDLINRMWINEAELDGRPGVDDDGNGYVDDVYGFDFYNFDGNPFDDNGHGTHCAGTIAAEAGNGVDIAGVCWKGRIMALKFLNKYGSGTIEDASAAIIYAVQNGADVISCSWGGTDYSQMLSDAINYAHSQGAVVVAGAGNNNSSQLFYPAADENVISVAATNSNDAKAPFSNYSSWVDIAAPGVDILSLRPAATYSGVAYNAFTSISSGTSMSCPFVSGAFALLLSVDPQQDANSAALILYETADTIESYICSSGRLNLSRAVGALVRPAGRLRLNKQVYSNPDEMKIYLYDADLKGGDNQTITASVMYGDVERVELAEMNIGSGIFSGTLPISVEGSGFDGVLQVKDGDTIEADYFDANVGDGNSAFLRYYALVDYPPVVTGLDVNSLSFQAERITVQTDKPTKVVLECGQDCGGPYDIKLTDSGLDTCHQFDLIPLTEQSQYHFVLTLTDAAGTTVVDNNDGNCFSFTTVARQDFIVPEVFATIQAAVDGAWNGDVITVEDGTYKGQGNRDIDFRGRDLTLRSRGGSGNCIIDCNGSSLSPHRAFYFHNGESKDAILDGFSIINGHVPDEGGAVKCWKSGPTIHNCRFIGNCAEANEARGGAISNSGGDMKFTDCEFIGNMAVNTGVDVNYEGLLSGTEGGAIYNGMDSEVEVNNCVFVGNLAASGGGMSSVGLNAGEVVNSIFSGNFARGGDGGGMCNFSGMIGLVNCTFAGNIATYYAGGVAGDAESYTQIKNSIFWCNEDEAGQIEISQIYGGYFDISYSCVEGWTGTLGGVGNIGSDPLFANAGVDFHLKSQAGRWDPNSQVWVKDEETSPCIDGGSPSSNWQAELWPNGKRINMGAYGGTDEASKNGNPADFDVDGIVGFTDFALLADKWMVEGNFFEDLDVNGIVDSADLCIFVDNWMWEK